MGNVLFPSSNISGHNSAAPIIITDVILEESFAFIPSCSHDPNDLSQVWWIHKWNHLTLPESQCHTFVSVGALNTTLLVEFKGLFVLQRAIALEYHHILGGCLQRLYPILTALYTDEHCVSFHLTQLVHSLSLYTGVYASSNGIFDWIAFHIQDMEKSVPCSW